MIGQVSIRTRGLSDRGDDGRSQAMALRRQKAINAGARNAPRARDPRQAHNNETWKVRPSGSSSRPPSGQRAFWPQWLAILADSNSLSMVISPTLDCSRAISSSRSSLLRAFLQGLERRAGQRSIPPFGQLGHRERIRFPGDDIQRFATQQTRHHRHLALDGIAASVLHRRPRGRPRRLWGRAATGAPLGLQPCINRHFRNLRLRFNYRSQMSQLTVTHPILAQSFQFDVVARLGITFEKQKPLSYGR